MNSKKVNLQIYSLLEMESDYYLMESLYKKGARQSEGAISDNQQPPSHTPPFQWFFRRPFWSGCALFVCSFLGFILGSLIWSAQMPHRFWWGLFQGVIVYLLLAAGAPLILYVIGRILSRHSSQMNAPTENGDLSREKIQHQTELLEKYYDTIKFPTDYRNYVALLYLTDALENTTAAYSLNGVEDLAFLMASVKQEMENDQIWEFTKGLVKDIAHPERYLEHIDRLLPHLKPEHRQSLEKIQEKADRLVQSATVKDFYTVQETKYNEYSYLFL